MNLGNGIIDWIDIRALMANRLIAPNKCPGIRPIGSVLAVCWHW